MKTHRFILDQRISLGSFDDQGLVVEGWGNRNWIALLTQIGARPTASHLRRSNSTFDLVVGRSLI